MKPRRIVQYHVVYVSFTYVLFPLPARSLLTDFSLSSTACYPTSECHLLPCFDVVRMSFNVALPSASALETSRCFGGDDEESVGVEDLADVKNQLPQAIANL